MELYIFIMISIMFIALLGAIIYWIIDKFNKSYIKNNRFLFMINGGENPCDKNQTIVVTHRYIHPNSWIEEV